MLGHSSKVLPPAVEAAIRKADYIWWPKVLPGSKEAFDYATKIKKE